MKLTASDVATLLNVSEKSVYRWMAERRLPGHLANNSYRFNCTQLSEEVRRMPLPLVVNCVIGKGPDARG